MTLVQMSAILLPFTAGAMLGPERWFMAAAIPAPIYLAAVHGVSRRLHSDYVAMLLAQHSYSTKPGTAASPGSRTERT